VFIPRVSSCLGSTRSRAQCVGAADTLARSILEKWTRVTHKFFPTLSLLPCRAHIFPLFMSLFFWLNFCLRGSFRRVFFGPKFLLKVFRNFGKNRKKIIFFQRRCYFVNSPLLSCEIIFFGNIYFVRVSFLSLWAAPTQTID